MNKKLKKIKIKTHLSRARPLREPEAAVAGQLPQQGLLLLLPLLLLPRILRRREQRGEEGQKQRRRWHRW